MIKRYFYLFGVLYKIGLINIYRVAIHRVKIYLGLYCTENMIKNNSNESSNLKLKPSELLFSDKLSKKIIISADHVASGNISFFGGDMIFVGSPPTWFYEQEYIIKNHWSSIKLNQFVNKDVKMTWELSRFYWAPVLASAFSLTSDKKYSDLLELWLNNWILNNPVNNSVNWACAQEVSIRLINLLSALTFPSQLAESYKVLNSFVEDHCARIFLTLGYSISQDNNHGSSEAAALFIGGSWLAKQKSNDPITNKYYVVGRKWLENRAVRLFQHDGTSIQYSTNYHRVVLDTYSIVEAWRIYFKLPKFSKRMNSRLGEAANFLYQITEEKTGDTPNTGANDGSSLLFLSNLSYRDYRPSIQLAYVLFNKKLAFADIEEVSFPLRWLRVPITSRKIASQKHTHFPDGGYALLRTKVAFILFNTPRFKFRPSQCDALHLDFWLNGENILRDGGTYSYNSSDQDINYFAGIESHNTIQFDSREQMPRISRFLLGAWLKAKEIIPVSIQQDGSQYTAASYTDYQRAYHHRSVSLYQNKLIIIDNIKGFKQSAVLRWRLKPDNWVINQKEQTLKNNDLTIKITTSLNILRFELTEGWESRYYMKKTALPVLEIEVNAAGTITTEIIFNQ